MTGRVTDRVTGRDRKPDKKPMTKEQAAGELKTFFLRLAILAGLIFVIFGVVFGAAVMPDQSMKPGIGAGDLLFLYRMENHYKSGDVIVYRTDEGKRAGRIVAKVGDTVAITEDQELEVNGSVVIENDIYFQTPMYDSDVTYPVTLAENEFFVLGDHREDAEDSRWSGPVAGDAIIGKVITVIRRNNI
jgi:signal peptidase I